MKTNGNFKLLLLKAIFVLMLIFPFADNLLWGQGCTGYTLDQAKICSEIDAQNATCAQEAFLFSPGFDIPKTLIVLSKVSGTMAVRFVWYRPDGTEYTRQTTGTFVGNCGNFWFTYNVGAIPASEQNMGTWRVDFQLSNNGAAFQTVASPTFEVGCYCTLQYPQPLVCTQDGRILTACYAKCAGIPISSNFSNCCDLTDVTATFTPTSCSSNTGNLTVRWNKSVFEDFGYGYSVLVRNLFNNATYSSTTTNNTFLFPLMPAGTYSIEVSINGCKGQTQISAESSLLSISTNSSTPSCGFSNGSITTTLSGGTPPYRYLWSNGSTSANLTNLPAGTFSLTVTDKLGCTATKSNNLFYTIATPSAASVSNISINSAILSWPKLSGITTYRIDYRLLSTTTWNSINSSLNPFTLTNLSANSDYEVRIIALCGADPGNPSGITRFKTLACNLDFGFNATEPNCAQSNGSIAVSVNSGVSPYRYSWNNGATTATLSNLGAGTYQVTVTDNQGCTLNKSYSLVYNLQPPPQINFSSVTTTSATLTWGNTNSSYRLEYKLNNVTTWTGINTSTNSYTLTGLIPNSGYQVRIFSICNTLLSSSSTSANFNTLSTQAPVVKITAPINNTQFRAPANITITAEATDPDSPVEKVEFYRDNTLFATVPSAPYTTDLKGMGAGVYVIEARAYDANLNRGISPQVRVQVLPTCTLDFTLAANATTCGLNNAKIEVLNVTGGSPFSYQWNTGATNNALQNLAAGNYQLTITDANNCQISKAVAVASSVKPVPDLNYTISSKGLEIKITNNSTNLEKWFWDFGDGGSSPEVAPSHLYAKAGTYSISGFAENSCEKINLIPRTLSLTPEIEDQNKLRLWLPKTQVAPGGVLSLPLQVGNFKDVIGVQFTLKLENSGADIVEVLPSAAFNQLTFLKINAQTYSFIWLPDPPKLHSFPDSTKMLDLKIKLSATVPLDSCIRIGFNSIPTDLIAFQSIKGVETEVIPLTFGGQICAQKLLIGSISGKITGINNQAFPNVPVFLKTDQILSTRTNSGGQYTFSAIPLNRLYTLFPSLYQDHLNGVNISDVLALRQHILGVNRIIEPALLIAADVNASKSINLNDLVTMMRVILGEIDSFPNQPSWRFVANANLLDGRKEWTALPFDYQVRLDSGNAIIPFTAIKLGDITRSASLRADPSGIPLEIEDRKFEAAQILELPMPFSSAANAWQMDLGFDQRVLSFQGIEFAENELELRFNVLPNGQLSIVALNKQAANPTVPLRIKIFFKTLDSGYLSQAIWLPNDRIHPFAVVDDQEHPLNLIFTKSTQSNLKKAEFAWQHRIVPNPARHPAQLFINIPAKEQGVIRFFELSGKLVAEKPLDLQSGLNQVKLMDVNQWKSGLYLYQIQLKQLILSGRFVIAH